MTLEGGKTVSIDASSISKNGSSVMVLGSPTYVWEPGATLDRGRVVEDSAIGVLRDDRGRAHAVPTPLPGQRVLYPRVASAGSLGWHVLFFTGRPEGSSNPVMFDTATIWYGRFDGDGWHGVEKVGSVASAMLLPRMSSDLVVSGGALGFAFAFDESSVRKSNAPGNQGLVLVRRSRERWMFDTLRTWAAPNYAQLAAGPDIGQFTAAITQSYFENQRSWPSSLFLTLYDSTWHHPRAVAIDNQSGNDQVVFASALLVLGRRVTVAWQTGQFADPNIVRIVWGTFRADDAGANPVVQRGTVGPGLALDMFAMVALDTRGVLWLLRDGNSRSRVRSVLGVGSTAVPLGTFEAPLNNFRILAVAQSDSTVLLVTGGLAASPNDPPASSYFTLLRLRCRPERQP